MALLKKKELMELNAKDLDKKLSDLRLELIKANVQKSAQNPLKIREIKRAIARILTRMNLPSSNEPKGK